jgi:hypothetical protein
MHWNNLIFLEVFLSISKTKRRFFHFFSRLDDVFVAGTATREPYSTQGKIEEGTILEVQKTTTVIVLSSSKSQIYVLPRKCTDSNNREGFCKLESINFTVKTLFLLFHQVFLDLNSISLRISTLTRFWRLSFSG